MLDKQLKKIILKTGRQYFLKWGNIIYE
jgi:hypothetical protein